jgi:hypothetical protein
LNGGSVTNSNISGRDGIMMKKEQLSRSSHLGKQEIDKPKANEVKLSALV